MSSNLWLCKTSRLKAPARRLVFAFPVIWVIRSLMHNVNGCQSLLWPALAVSALAIYPAEPACSTRWTSLYCSAFFWCYAFREQLHNTGTHCIGRSENNVGCEVKQGKAIFQCSVEDCLSLHHTVWRTELQCHQDMAASQETKLP